MRKILDKFLRFQLILYIFSFSLSIFLLYSCKQKIDAHQPINGLPDNEVSQEKVKIDTFPLINYKLIKFKGNLSRRKFFDSLKKTPNYSDTTLRLLNRKDWGYLINSEEIIVPEVFSADRRAYSIFPPYYKGAAKLKKFIIMSAYYQCVAFYEYGKLVRFAAVNSGKEKTQSYPGRYALTFKQLVRHSSIDSTWIMKYYFNMHPEAGMAFHQFTMPGYPASHSCSRMFEEDAKWLYGWGEGVKLDSNRKPIPLSGTPVVIIDHYPFGVKYRPWMQIESNRSVTLDLPDDPMKIEEPLIPISQIPEDSRGMLRHKERFMFAEDSLRKLGVIRAGVEITKSVNFNKLRRQKKALELKQKQKLEKQKQELENKETNQ
jgi:hypothetical protein